MHSRSDYILRSIDRDLDSAILFGIRIGIRDMERTAISGLLNVRHALPDRWLVSAMNERRRVRGVPRLRLHFRTTRDNGRRLRAATDSKLGGDLGVGGHRFRPKSKRREEDKSDDHIRPD